MVLLALGLNHRTAPVQLRERVSFAPERIPAALGDLVRLPAVHEAAILSTCNRTEIYCRLAPQGVRAAEDWFLDQHPDERAALGDALYRHLDADGVRHLMRVACGLDSLVLGEPQILGQLKQAYRQACAAGTLGPQLQRLFHSAFAAAKQVRSQTELGVNPVSVAYAAVRLARRIFADPGRLTALLIGAGETIELAARHLREQGVRRMIVANRTRPRAQALAQALGGECEAIALDQLGEHLAEADIVISSTASPLPIIGKGAVERALRRRKHRPMYMVDLAVPRDIEPEVGELADVYLYNIDDLEALVEENRRSRQAAAVAAEAIVARKVDEFLAWQRSLEAVDLIRRYRRRAETLGEATVARALRRLRAGEAPEAVLHRLGRELVQRLSHAPTAAFHRAAREPDGEALAWLRRLLCPPEEED